MANHVKPDSPFAIPVEGSGEGYFLLQIFISEQFSVLHRYPPGSNGFHACGFQEQISHPQSLSHRQ